MGGSESKSESKSNSASKSASAASHLVARGFAKSFRSLSAKEGSNGEINLDWAERYRDMKITKLQKLKRPIKDRDFIVVQVQSVE